MTTRPATLPSTTVARIGSTFLGSLALLPSAVLEMVGLLRGDRAGALRRAGRTDMPARPGPAVILAHALLTGVLGLVIWFLTGLALLGAARGPFYGFVDAGPYDHSWGGPSLAGAWVVHAAVWLVVLPVWAMLTRALTALARAVTGRLLDGDGPRFAVPVALVVTAGAALFARAWLHQL